MGQRPIQLPVLTSIVGVDFSGAAKSGKTAWIAELAIQRSGTPLRLIRLDPLGRRAESDDRAHVNQYLVDRILASRQTGWGMDFPFGLPIELELGGWPQQLDHVAGYLGEAPQYGRDLVEISQRVSGRRHIRRVTDGETQTPFDCYHYRIIYQTFHGMRDVLAPIANDRRTAVLPFHYARLRSAERVVVEACPASTLKRLGLPHRLYKQTAGKSPDATHRKNRQVILRHLNRHVEWTPHRRRVLMQDPGGDALDALIAAVGTWMSIYQDDHRAIADHDRYPLEGRVYC